VLDGLAERGHNNTSTLTSSPQPFSTDGGQNSYMLAKVGGFTQKKLLV